MKFWNWLKEKILGHKVLTKYQYDELIENLTANKDEFFNKADANGNGTIELSEILTKIKEIIKK